MGTSLRPELPQGVLAALDAINRIICNAPWRRGSLGPWSDAIPSGKLAGHAVLIRRADQGAAEPRTLEMPKPAEEGGP